MTVDRFVKDGAEGISKRTAWSAGFIIPKREARPLSAQMTVRCYPRSRHAEEKLLGVVHLSESSLTGDEPADVLEYHAHSTEFPHQSTADQFFSESQFESYRRLGLHVLRSAFEGIPRAAAGANDPHPQAPW